MPTSTEEIDIQKLLINGRQGRAFRDFDRSMKEWLTAEYKHMSKYFYTGTRKKVAQRQKNRRKRYADEIYNLLDKRGSRSKSRWSVPEECSARMIIEWFSEQHVSGLSAFPRCRFPRLPWPVRSTCSFSCREDGSIFCLGSPRRPTSTSLARFPRRPEHGTARARLLARAPSSKSRRAFVGKTSDATLLSSRGG